MTASSANEAIWDPDQQIYVGGVIPNHNEAAVDDYLNGSSEDGSTSTTTLRIFGYGSLCWGPGTGALAKEGVTTQLGRAIGYKRCWAQKSTDHRGVPSFPGIVCTLLRDDEVKEIRQAKQQELNAVHVLEEDKPSMTEGVVYTIPQEQVEDCLAELDFREKGGYARDVVEVLIDNDDKTSTVKALLYRGTPDNPAFWDRTLFDLPLAAAIMSVSVGPSGPNDVYLFNLDHFMSDSATTGVTSETVDHYHGDTDTNYLASMAKRLQKQQLYFLVGCGSNQHDQLLLQSETNSAALVNNGEDAHDLKEMVLCTDKMALSDDARVKQLAAGGGHSALLTESGELYLWGWNEASQLGRNAADKDDQRKDGDYPHFSVIPKLEQNVELVALGFSHTLFTEKESKYLYAFGSNNRGQVDASTSATIDTPTLLHPDKRFVAIAAGLFHSAAITEEGDLITFGCRRSGQTLSSPSWRPTDGSRLVKVACGRHHTMVLDEHDRIWTMGKNKYGQLGRSGNNDDDKKKSQAPQLVDGFLGEKGSGCFEIDCGWSHCVVSLQNQDDSTRLYGWGRNDKGQLGLGMTGNIVTPTSIFEDVLIKSYSCGSESTMVVDASASEKLWGCGWNEHGNLGTGNDEDCLTLQQVTGARVLAPPPSDGKGDILLAAGGAHVLAMRTI